MHADIQFNNTFLAQMLFFSSLFFAGGVQLKFIQNILKTLFLQLLCFSMWEKRAGAFLALQQYA